MNKAKKVINIMEQESKEYEVTFTLIVPAENPEEAANGFNEYVAEKLREMEGFTEDDLEIKETHKGK